MFVWRTPHGHVSIVDADGTHDYGRGRLAYQLWQATTPCPQREMTATVLAVNELSCLLDKTA